MTNTHRNATKLCRALIVVGMVVISAAAHAQRDEAPVARTSHYKTPCTSLPTVINRSFSGYRSARPVTNQVD